MGVFFALAALAIAVDAHRRPEPDRGSIRRSLAALAGGLAVQCIVWFVISAAPRAPRSGSIGSARPDCARGGGPPR